MPAKTGGRLQANPKPFNAQEIATIKKAKDSFATFLLLVFPESFRGQKFMMADGKKHPFTLSKIHYIWADLVQNNPRICILAPRAHLKSTILTQAFGFWNIFKADKNVEGVVVSYKEDLAKKHVSMIKDFVRDNPYCRFWTDRKHVSDGVIDYDVKFAEHEKPFQCSVDPYGIMSAMRGRHPNFVICDDILSDFSNPLEPTEIRHIDQIYRSVIESMPDESEPLVLVGTPQSFEDTLYRLRYNSEYVWARFPAEISEGQTLWPEKFDWSRLRRTENRIHSDAYRVEYLLEPAMAVNSFLSQEAIDANVDPQLKSLSLDEPFENPHNYPVYAGMDVGREVHPSHISVGIKVPDGTLVQVYQQFLDGADYNTQAKLVNRIIDHFNVQRFYYDNTRGELKDRHLSRRAIGLPFSTKLKGHMALLLEARMYAASNESGIILLNDKRQIKQLAGVNRELKSIETSEGHGDSFWSIALMCKACEDGPRMKILGDASGLFGLETSPRTAPSLL